MAHYAAVRRTPSSSASRLEGSAASGRNRPSRSVFLIEEKYYQTHFRTQGGGGGVGGAVGSIGRRRRRRSW